MEFDADNSLKKEHTLYHIYAENGYWPDDLNMLLTDFNITVDNRGLNDEDHSFARRRLICQQVCQDPTHSCSYCDKRIALVNTIDKH